jgi:DNA-binding transcriptional ArsR family regulator
MARSGPGRVDRRRIERLKKIYYAISYIGEPTVSQLVDLLGIPRRTLYYHLTYLVEKGYVVKERRGLTVRYRVARPFREEEILEEASIPKDEPPVYAYARRVANILDKYGFLADLVGACKIHLSVPRHNRITVDIDLVVAKDHAKLLVDVIKMRLGFVELDTPSTSIDYKLFNPVERIGMDISVDGFKEGGTMVWNLRPELEKHRRLLLEHAVVGKLSRRNFDERTDGYDIAVSLPYIDIKTVAEVANNAIQQSPEIAPRILGNLERVKKYMKAELPEAYDVGSEILNRIKEKLLEENRVIRHFTKMKVK